MLGEEYVKRFVAKDEKEYLPALFRERPNACRFGTVKKLLEINSDYACDLEDTIADLKFNRKSDAWEIIDGKFIWYEIDGSHQTTADKIDNLSQLADESRGMTLNLFLYDCRADVTYFYNTEDLAHVYVDLLLMESFEISFDWYKAYPKTVRCTAKAFGLDYSLLSLAT